MPDQARPSLTKWYCDCVSATGDVFLGYWAVLSWGSLTLPYASSLFRPAGGRPREHRTTRAGAPPAPQEGTLEWDCRALGIRGRWIASRPPHHRTLLDDVNGSIAWRCHVPAADAHVRLPDGTALDGLGYAEELTLAVAPSRLPFDELHWGRFLSERDALTWILWRGETPRQWVLHNGVALSGAAIDEGRVRLPGGRGVLELRDAVTLRDGPLASTALRAIPATGLRLLRGIERAHETKWLSAGTLTDATHTSSGWAIHEVVRLWPG